MSDEPQAPGEPDPLAGLDPVQAANLRPTLFRKGQSGNPGGRPKVYQAVSEYIRQLAGPDAKVYIDKLHEIAVNPHRDTRSRITALEILLDRGYGRAPQEIQLSGSVAALDPARLVRLTDAELEQAADLVAKLVGMSRTRSACRQKSSVSPLVLTRWT